MEFILFQARVMISLCSWISSIEQAVQPLWLPGQVEGFQVAFFSCLFSPSILEPLLIRSDQLSHWDRTSRPQSDLHCNTVACQPPQIEQYLNGGVGMKKDTHTNDDAAGLQ